MEMKNNLNRPQIKLKCHMEYKCKCRKEPEEQDLLKTEKEALQRGITKLLKVK